MARQYSDARLLNRLGKLEHNVVAHFGRPRPKPAANVAIDALLDRVVTIVLQRRRQRAAFGNFRRNAAQFKLANGNMRLNVQHKSNKKKKRKAFNNIFSCFRVATIM